MFGVECKQLFARSIIAQFLWHLAFLVEHKVEQRFAVASALHALVDVKVEYTDRSELLDLPAIVAMEQITLADLEETDD